MRGGGQRVEVVEGRRVGEVMKGGEKGWRRRGSRGGSEGEDN